MSKNDDIGVRPVLEPMGANSAEAVQRMMAADIRSIAADLKRLVQLGEAWEVRERSRVRLGLSEIAHDLDVKTDYL